MHVGCADAAFGALAVSIAHPLTLGGVGAMHTAADKRQAHRCCNTSVACGRARGHLKRGNYCRQHRWRYLLRYRLFRRRVASLIILQTSGAYRPLLEMLVTAGACARSSSYQRRYDDADAGALTPAPCRLSSASCRLLRIEARKRYFIVNSARDSEPRRRPLLASRRTSVNERRADGIR